MKILLSIIICSSVAGECMPPIAYKDLFPTEYDCLHFGYAESQRRLEGYKELVKMQRQEIYDLKKFESENIKLKNLLQGYKKVIEDISKSGSKSNVR